ncbi:hypothetical protein L3Y34_002395 [Caenorhabditis briggsae]|uniref:Uncharacterized protein n=1 Tax=Caenorhabditis briggsae TaxID=6238 RepID=A0AAE9IRL3_CAEBR|nr:hypothetical protein L3Y34_002395 [Caenorhabditis briggsae]
MRWVPLVLLPLIASAGSTYQHRQTYSSLQCRVNDPLSCNQAKSEVCVFVNGQYRCECPVGVSRLPDGRCMVVNECARPSLNACHKDAQCIDLAEGYTCRCNSGFADTSPDKVNKPGRQCQKTMNECGAKSTYGVDCDENAACVDTPEGFQCVCQPGYVDVSTSISKLPGRKCVESVNECTNGEADCSNNADCFDRADGYECKCRPGFVDASPNVDKYPGRVCNKPKAPEYYGQQSRQPQCSEGSGCGPNEECRFNTAGEKVCQCRRGSVQQSNGVCKVFSQCEQANECDRNAFCSNTYDGPKCQCKDGYLDVSPDPVRLPGRKCQQIKNECADGSHDCSHQADCQDTPTGYICSCKSNCIDVSSRYNLPPGRKCSVEMHRDPAANQCSDKSLNSCDENADCVQLPDGYTCKCFSGYVDVSSNANLPPGRVCTLSTACPAQPTDLVFLIDGSGSIGSYVFQTEVLRFLAEFTELFDIAPQKTRVSVVQYSDQIRHEFGLDNYSDRKSLQNAIRNIEYLTGLTRTGAAIEHVANEAFSERRGARPVGQVSRVAIVITDGRSQDNVTRPSNNAHKQDIQLFAVGVTNHVLDAELEEISGSKDRTFHVSGFEDLNTRLRSAIQRVACPHQNNEDTYNKGPCDPRNHNGCDRSLNQVCQQKNGKFVCVCPAGFDIHPVTKVCGGDICNPEIATSCPDPEICEKTPFGNWRCTCPADLGWRDKFTGVCKIGEKAPETSESTDECSPNDIHSCPPNSKCEKGAGGEFICKCDAGFQRNGRTNKCEAPGTCDPRMPESCDARKKEKCLPDGRGAFACMCDRHHKRHPVTDICLIDECAAGVADCDPNAKCTDTDESFICTCNEGFLDKSPEQNKKPGRVCSKQRNECLDGTHNCSMNADCIDLPDGFLCRCKEDFVDISPNPSAFGGLDCRALVNECLIPGGHNCHEHAICIDTRDSYKCQCKEGYVDHDELRNPGRTCKKLNQICESGKHECDKNARCVEKGANDYECVCNAGFIDKSPLVHRPGRKCVEPICSDDSKHDCHSAAICEENDSVPEKYTCKCRDGYLDVGSVMGGGKAGRECKELVNECLSSSLNSCDAAATCIDLDDGYTCKCPLGSKDESPDPKLPGRSCKGLVNECNIPHLNNCSHFATCIDLEEGYECKCKPEYYDQQPEQPGTQCKFIINECLAENLNDCSPNAMCIDKIDGYECKCKAPFEDMMPANAGRICRFDECANPKDNDCDKNAICIDTDDSYTCQCKEGFFDEISDPKKPGRVCIGLVIEAPNQAEDPTTPDPNTIKCGNGLCHLNLGEVCVGGATCACRPGESRDNDKEKCVPVTSIPLVVRVMEYDGEPIQYRTDYSKPDTPAHVEIVDAVKKSVGKIIGKTEFAPRFVTTDVNYITNPKVKNSDWDKGLLGNVTVQLAGKEDVDNCRLYEQFAEVVREMGGRVDRIKLSDDADLDPCRKEDVKKGIPCGNTFCSIELGEECIAGRICGCPKGQKRRDASSPCRAVESWNIPLYVVRDGHEKITYSPALSNPLNDEHKDLVTRFESGIGQSYDKTPLKSSFVTAEVNEIENPESRKKSWDTGILYNFTSHFVRGGVAEPSSVFTELIDYIQKRNNMEVGKSKLFISPEQLNPFSTCYHSDCHPDAICKEVGKGYTCTCPDGFRDLNPSRPGRNCLSFRGVNECEKPELNECSPHARCIDLDYLYKCECIRPYVNSALGDALPGSVCSIDYCQDVNYCPLNSTCVNVDEQARCDCKPGFVDLRKSEQLSTAGLGDAICLRKFDIDECALGLHNCSAAATCIDKKDGYECKCQEGYEDGNPALPGRICAAQLCGLCNGHGDCIHDAQSANVTCACLDGYTGEFCQTAPSQLPLILMLLLALLFLLLTLLCCLYMCARCRCFGARGRSEGSASGQEILGSDYYTIPRAKLARPLYGDEMGDDHAGALAAYLDDGASISSDGSIEEIERRVTTDVTTREVRTTTVRDESGNIISQSQTVSHGNPHETDTEQYGMISSDHYKTSASEAMDAAMSASASGAAYQRRGGAMSSSATSSAYNQGYASDSEDSDAGHAVYDRTTRTNQSHDFEPGADPRTGTERTKREFVTSTKAEEVNYF